jgi:hypothetical protein
VPLYASLREKKAGILHGAQILQLCWDGIIRSIIFSLQLLVSVDDHAREQIETLRS